MLDLYHSANKARVEGEQLNPSDFYNDGVNKEIELKSHYFKWEESLQNEEYDKHSNFTLCHYPWILDTASKGEILKYES